MLGWKECKAADTSTHCNRHGRIFNSFSLLAVSTVDRVNVLSNLILPEELLINPAGPASLESRPATTIIKHDKRV